MEPDDLFADEMRRDRPVAIQSLGVIWEANAREGVGQGIDPDV
jgi:hypothetical protein